VLQRHCHRVFCHGLVSAVLLGASVAIHEPWDYLTNDVLPLLPCGSCGARANCGNNAVDLPRMRPAKYVREESTWRGRLPPPGDERSVMRDEQRGLGGIEIGGVVDARGILREKDLCTEGGDSGPKRMRMRA
jgi:hypothetical protein